MLLLFSAHAAADVFSQAGPGTFDSTMPLISQVNFSDDELIVDVEIEISGLDYNWAGDLVLTLTSPLGSKIDLVRRLGKSDFQSDLDSGSSTDFRGNYTFTDDGSQLSLAAGNDVIPSGDYLSSTAGGQVQSLVGKFGNESTFGTWTLHVEDFDEEDSGVISGWSITAKSVADPECDFNSDGICDVLDLDGPIGLYGVGDLKVGVAEEDSIYDIVPDGRIDTLDLHLWLGAAAHRNGFAQGYRKGDLDLNGTIEFADFLALSNSFGSGRLWSEGNPRGGGETAFGDFLSLSENFGETIIRQTAPAAIVPEPTSSLLFAIAMGLFISVRSRRFRSIQTDHMRVVCS